MQAGGWKRTVGAGRGNLPDEWEDKDLTERWQRVQLVRGLSIMCVGGWQVGSQGRVCHHVCCPGPGRHHRQHPWVEIWHGRQGMWLALPWQASLPVRAQIKALLCTQSRPRVMLIPHNTFPSVIWVYNTIDTTLLEHVLIWLDLKYQWYFWFFIFLFVW